MHLKKLITSFNTLVLKNKCSKKYVISITTNGFVVLNVPNDNVAIIPAAEAYQEIALATETNVLHSDFVNFMFAFDCESFVVPDDHNCLESKMIDLSRGNVSTARRYAKCRYQIGVSTQEILFACINVFYRNFIAHCVQ